MEASTAHAESHGHMPVANASVEFNREKLGMLLFIFSEVMLFASFFTAYFFIRVVQGGEWMPAGQELPVGVAFANSAILFSSSATMHWALEGVRHNNRKALKAGLVLTILLGATFLGVQISEYAHLGFLPKDSAQATAFFSLTGLHGTHVAVGLIILCVVARRAFKGHYGPEKDKHWGVEIPGIYWHFVDVMWFFVFTSLYLL
ncbi:MAG: heme-copper oxidase subunit III [Actinobacteria bacterium]|nr:heme-copper oxidase subunit III [Actinomycetota bacterium]